MFEPPGTHTTTLALYASCRIINTIFVTLQAFLIKMTNFVKKI